MRYNPRAPGADKKTTPADPRILPRLRTILHEIPRREAAARYRSPSVALAGKRSESFSGPPIMAGSYARCEQAKNTIWAEAKTPTGIRSGIYKHWSMYMREHVRTTALSITMTELETNPCD